MRLPRPTVTPLQLRGLEVLFWLGFAACFFVFPDQLYLLTQILIAGLFAVALDLALGYAGILTLGHAVFFGLGAYAAGLLSKYGWGEPFSGLALAALLCGLLGYLTSVLVIRGAPLTQLMVTIAVVAVVGEIANQWTPVTGGSDGLQGMDMWPVLGLFRFDLWGRTGFVYAFAVVLACFLFVRLVLKSPFGLALRGIHDNRRRMAAIGSPVAERLRVAFCFSAGLAGVAGALMAQTTQFVGLDSLSLDKSAEILIVLIVGGTGRLYGGLIGAIIYMIVHDIFADLSPAFWMFWLGIFLIAVVMIGRGGFLGLLSRLFRVEAER